MARARNIKPGFFANETLASLDLRTRLLFIGLWTYADKEGRFEVRLEKINGSIFPYEQVMLEPCMTQLWDKQFLTMYEDGGKHFCQINNWQRHQSPHHKEISSEIPKCKEEKYFNNQEDIHAWLKHESCITQSRFKQSASSPLIPDSLIPDSLIPDSLIPDSLIPDSLIPDSLSATAVSSTAANAAMVPVKQAKPKTTPSSRDVWERYSQEYQNRYGATPVRNATVNGQMAQFVKRIGVEESPEVAAFYVHHNQQFYVQQLHPVGLLLKDAEKLRTEWATGRGMTNRKAREIEGTQANLDSHYEALEILQQRGHNV